MAVKKFSKWSVKKKLRFFVGAILALALSFSTMKKISCHFNPALIFWFFSPAPALCGDQEKRTNNIHDEKKTNVKI
jgi:hypothetical protein